MKLIYINSQGKSFDLMADGLRRVKDANFHSYAWKAQGVTQKYGIKIQAFTKDPYQYKTTLLFSGPTEERKENLNAFHEAMAYDIIAVKPGKLIWNDYYLECYITSSDTYPSDLATQNDVVIYAPYPFWIRRVTKQFYPSFNSFNMERLTFPADFAFDFASPKSGIGNWEINHYAPSHFELIVYGPCVNPRILVNGYPYQVFTELQYGEYLVIDSRNNTIKKHTVTGSIENLYNSRQFTPSVFEKIPSGQVTFNWSGDFGFDIALYLERSEPKW